MRALDQIKANQKANFAGVGVVLANVAGGLIKNKQTKLQNQQLELQQQLEAQRKLDAQRKNNQMVLIVGVILVVVLVVFMVKR